VCGRGALSHALMATGPSAQPKRRQPPRHWWRLKLVTVGAPLIGAPHISALFQSLKTSFIFSPACLTLPAFSSFQPSASSDWLSVASPTFFLILPATS
jgi:hypothetical protein